MAQAVRGVFFSGFTFWIGLLVVSLYFLYPLDKSVKRGIDLVGGTFITLEVQVEKAVEAALLERLQTIPTRLEAAGRPLPTAKKVFQNEIELVFADVAAAQSAAEFFKLDEQELQRKVDGNIVKLFFDANKIRLIQQDAISGNVEVLRTRLDKLGVAEITIVPQGDRTIVVELPDVSDPQQAKSMIGKSATLEFKLVERVGPTPDDILYEYDGELPEGMEIVPGKMGKEGRRMYYLVPVYSDLTGKLLRDARPGLGGQTGVEMVVNFRFSPEGGEKFYELTSKNYGRQLAVVFDGEVITAPNISTGIRTDGYIHGDFTAESAKELAMLLKSGSFVAPVTFEEERQVGPSLGQESIHQGLISCLVSLGLLFLFGIYIYNVSGILAFCALLYNLILILVGLSLVGATLTLPGIAGMVLTTGMAIDASVLIFERIKEELAAGLTLKRAVNAGFSDAMEVILDGNITTFIVGVVLYKFGTGPIQGFAVTMMLGIISTLITGLFFLKSLFNFTIDTFKVQKLRI